MAQIVLDNLTVVDLRKIAKYYGIKLGAGLSKEDIIARLTDSLRTLPDAEDLPFLDSDKPARRGRPSAADKAAAEKAAAEEAAAAAPSHIVIRRAPTLQAEQLTIDSQPAEPAPAEKPAAETEKAAGQKRKLEGANVEVAWVNPSPNGRPGSRNWAAPRKPASPNDVPHLQTVRPANYTPRFGPGSADSAPAPRTTLRPARPESDLPPVEKPAEVRSGGDLFRSSEVTDVSGVFECHPDGYGFLRAADCLVPSSRDIYVSLNQARRYDLKPGDLITGTARPMRDADKYVALLTLETINGEPAAERDKRVCFDQLTPCYPSRSLPLSQTGSLDLGYGQRVLVSCEPARRKGFLIGLANSLLEKDPSAAVSVLLINIRPEDATACRQKTAAAVYAAAYDQSPDFSLRQADLLLERQLRAVEAGKDVFLLVDSLSDLASLYPIGVQQQARPVPGVPCPASLQKARRLFGAARATAEGGTLTVFAIADEADTETFLPMCSAWLKLDPEGKPEEASFVRRAES